MLADEQAYPDVSPPPALVSAALASPIDPIAENNKRSVSAHLKELRDQGRLAIHMCEQQKIYKMPRETVLHLRSVPANEIEQNLQSESMPLLSMSLLPDSKSGRSILPYGGHNFRIGHYGYLMDMRQDTLAPAKIMYACTKNLGTGGDVYHKKYWGKHRQTDSYHPDLAALYEQYPDVQAWRAALIGAQGGKLGEQQLDIVNESFQGEHPERMMKSGVCAHNELVVASSLEHMVAITIPCHKQDVPELQVAYNPLVRLTGAIAGLQHLSVGIDKPVVLYQVGKPAAGQTVEQGDCIYVGQGYKELVKVAVAALQELEKCHGYERIEHSEYRGILNSVRGETYHLLGIDIRKSLQDQSTILEHLEQLSSHEGRV